MTISRKTDIAMHERALYTTPYTLIKCPNSPTSKCKFSSNYPVIFEPLLQRSGVNSIERLENIHGSFLYVKPNNVLSTGWQLAGMFLAILVNLHHLDKASSSGELFLIILEIPEP